MSYTLRFLLEVEEDVMAAYGWYEDKAVGLGSEFLRGFYAHAATLQRTPLVFSKVHQDFRRGLLRRFPYHAITESMESSSPFTVFSIVPAILFR